MEKKIKVKLKKIIDNSYNVVFMSGILQHLATLLKTKHEASSYVIICDKTTERLFGIKLHKQLLRAGFNSFIFSIPSGEKSKNQNCKKLLEESMFRSLCDRNSLIIALGGGVVGDLAGFIASTYMRGIDYIQIPTTLLAMVDSSIGGKTGINNSLGKNLIGTFWQPEAVYIDLAFLKTLPIIHLRNGLFEIIKIFAVLDKKSFEFLQKNLKQILKKKSKILKEIIFQAITLKASVVSGDEKENSQRKILNFGHTIGHALEKLSKYRIMHGYAIAFGMLVETQIAFNLQILPKGDFQILNKILKDLGANIDLIKKYNFHQIIDITKGDKKSVKKNTRYVLLKKIGIVQNKNNEYVHKVTENEVYQALCDATVSVT